MDEDECILAVKHFGKRYMGSEETDYYPTGCYLYKSSIAYFNKDLSNVGNANAKAICKQGIFNHFSRVKNNLENMVVNIIV